MKSQSMLLAALASAPVALAHTAFTDIYVNGVPQGDAVAMRMSTNPERSTAPISSLGSDDMACNAGGTKGVARVASVPDGATLSFEIRAWPADASKERLERGHKGPCAVYLKKVASAIDDPGAGDGWFKIFENGYDASSSSWCSDKIIDNNGLLNVKLPTGLEGGAYLARPEILALHAANDNDPQFYTGCAQIFLESTGSLVPESTVSIPGYVDYGQPGTKFDIYNSDASTYEMPGPKLATLVSSSAQTANSEAMTQTEGTKPAGCLAENGNWCGSEVSDYTTEKGCWASGEECWAQAEECFAAAPVTGAAGCKLWQTKCQGINDACTAGDFQGPPNKGKVLTQDKESIDVGAVLDGGVTGGAATPAKPKPSSAAPKPSSAAPKPSSAAPKPSSAAPAPSSAAPAAPAAPSSAPAAYPTAIDDYASPPIIDTEDASAEDDAEAPAPAPAASSTVPSYDEAPATTPAPEVPASEEGGSSCQPGWACVTVTEIETVVQYVTVVAGEGEYKKRSGARVFRHRHVRR
ncbi:glycosyl hydrolase family 61-domain-containing protein [Boeremia exigua]|uniref:glycosyl hydrolase family 61-domain-containing protein n=1 Tax=Boeremia exigua TaxID=749465 RepID=UPI001E8EB7A4|nr:glycosyl hydrolase family 61-domain-containing protein [Boeremia exigua]KAH6614332.1 glycosyl hydrolase family 61-domain-containing protein [Boeremia exigua]